MASNLFSSSSPLRIEGWEILMSEVCFERIGHIGHRCTYSVKPKAKRKNSYVVMTGLPVICLTSKEAYHWLQQSPISLNTLAEPVAPKPLID